METHVSPKYDLYGRVLVEKAGSKVEKVKDPWSRVPKHQTRKDLLDSRKKDLLPDATFDIDGDGHVSNLDLFISKRFDMDKDGKLSMTERSNAENALKSGFLNNFRLGLESVGPNSTLRTIQKRGVIIENDISSKILETYPLIRHVSLPAITTRTQLINERKKNNNSIKPFENVFRLDVQKLKPEGFVAEPKFSSINDLKNSYKQSLRDKLGMGLPKDIKNAEVPGLDYVESPKYFSQTQMNTEKKRELLQNLHQKANYSHVSREENLLEREKYLISHNLPGHEGLTLKKIKEQQRLDTNNYNSKTFSNLSIGVHGKELPKFAENLNEYWKIKENYSENPSQVSHTILTLNKLNSGRIDKFKESDVTGNEIPIEPRKLPEKKNVAVADKPNHINPFGGYTPVENTESEFKVPNIKYRMSTVMGYFLESAAEMGINFLPVTAEKPVLTSEKTKTFIQENHLSSPVPEIPKTSNSIQKKNFLKTTGEENKFRTKGFINNLT